MTVKKCTLCIWEGYKTQFRKVQEGPRRFMKVQKGKRRFKKEKVKRGKRRSKKVQMGSRRCQKIERVPITTSQENLTPHVHYSYSTMQQQKTYDYCLKLFFLL